MSPFFKGAFNPIKHDVVAAGLELHAAARGNFQALNGPHGCHPILFGTFVYFGAGCGVAW